MKKIRTMIALLGSVVLSCFASAANVAKVGNTEYATIDAAIGAVQNGETIELLSDITVSGYFVYNKSFTIDGKGKTITCASANTNYPNYFVNVANGYAQTFKNVTINANEKVPYAIQCIGSASKLTLDNVTVQGGKTMKTKGKNDSYSKTRLGYGIHVNQGTVIAKDLTVKNCTVLPVYLDGTSSSVSLSGDKCDLDLIGTAGLNETVSSSAKGFYAYEVTASYKFIWTSTKKVRVISSLPWNEVISQVGDYTDITVNSATVKLLQDVGLSETFTSNDTKLTIDGDNKAITGTIKFTTSPSTIKNVVLGNDTTLDCTASTTTGFSSVSVAANATIDILLPSTTDISKYSLPVLLGANAIANITVGDKKYIAKGDVITPAETLAQVGDNQYATLQAAIDAANGATIHVLKDVALTASLNVPTGKTLTLNLAGRKVTITGADYALINNGSLTIIDQALVAVVEETSAQNDDVVPFLITCAASNDGVVALDDTTGGSIAGVQNNGTFALESGAVVAASASVPAIDNTANAVATITGGTVEGTLQSVDKSALTVTGGSFTGDSNVSDFVGGNYGVDDNGTVISYVAQLGATKYQTLQEAFAAAKEFDVVTVLDAEADVSGIAGYVAEGLFPISNGDKTYTLRAMPAATVEKLPAFTLTAERDGYACWPSGDTTIDRPLDIVMNFLANDDGKAEANESGFADWKCDFYLTFSGMAGASLEADGCYLAGNYGGFGWIVIPADDTIIDNNATLPVVAAYDANITYRQVCDTVKKFTAAIHVADAVMTANPDLKITLQLKMTNNKDASQELVVGSYTYTIDDLKGEFNPTVKVEDGATVTDTFKATVGSGLANAYQATEGKLEVTVVEQAETFATLDVSATDDYEVPAEGLEMTFPAQSVEDNAPAIIVHKHEGKYYVTTGLVEYGFVTYNNTLGFSEFIVGDEAALNAALAEGGEVILSSDIVLTETLTIPAGKTVTLDLNGKSISMEESIVTTAYALNNLGTLTLKDSVGTGSINARGIYNGYGNGGDNVATAKITVESGTYNAKGTNGGAAIFNYGIAEINGGSFTSIGGYSLNNQAGSSMTIADGVTANNGIYCSNAKVTVNGGNISGNRSGCHVVYAWNAELTINGGTFYNNNSGNATIMSAGTTECTITGGTFGIKDGRVEGNGNTFTSCLTDTANTATMAVTGGTFNGGFRVQAGTTMTINGGEFNNVGGSGYNIYGNAEVKGGTFTDADAKTFAADNLADGYKLGENGQVVENPKNIEVTDANGNVTYYAGFTGFSDLDLADCTIKLLNNVSDANLILNKGSTSKIVDTNVTLDLNGYTFSRTGSSSGAINLTNGAGLTIRDSSDAKTGKILVDTYAVWMMNGDFVLESGTIETTSTKNAAIYANAAEVAIKAGKIISAGDAITVGENFIESRGTSTIEISGGEIVAAGVGIKNGSYAQTETVVTVTGGTIDSEGDSISFTTGSAQVSGGTFSSDVSDYCVDGFEVKQNADGSYGVAANPAYGKVAKIGDNYYATLAEAVAAVADGGVIMLLANETFTEANRTSSGGSWYEGLYYVGDKSFTINLNGFKITQNGAVNDYLMLFKNEGSKANTITLQNGTMDAGSTAYCAICTSSASTQQIIVNLENVNVIGNNSNGSVLKIRGGTELNVKAGTKITGENSYLGIECVASTVNIYDGAEIYMNGTGSYNGCLVGVASSGTVNVYDGYGESVSGGFIAMTSGGTINVSGGEWIANTDGTYANSNKSVLIAQSDNGVKSIVNVSGGIFKGGYNCYGNAAGDAQINITGGNFNSDPATYVVDGYLAGLNAAGTYDVAKAVAKIGTTYYTSLAEAVAAAKSGDTIVLKAGEYELPLFANKELTFKGESKEGVIINDAPSAITQGWNGSTFHFENLTAKGATENYHGLANGVVAVTYKDCIIKGLRFLYANEVSFEDCAFKAEGVEHSFWTYGAPKVTVSNCSFSYTDRAVNCYSENGADHELDIAFTDCTFTYAGTADAPEGAVEINSGSVKSIELAMNNCTAPEKGEMWYNSQWDSKKGENTAVSVNGASVWPLVAKIGDEYYATLSAAFAAVTDDNQTVTILKDVTENLTGAYLRGNITTENDAKVTITLTNSDWVYCPYTFVLGANVTLKCPALFYYAGGTQINGTLIVDAYYQQYAGTKLTINEPGSMTVTSETFILRYTDGDANAGIYINGDNNDETIGLKLAVAYFYQGMISAKDANLQVGTYWQTNDTDNQGSANLVLDNSSLDVMVNEHNMKATGNSTVTLKNGSSVEVAGGYQGAAVKMDATSTFTKNGNPVLVAKIGDEYYATLSAAVDAAQEGDVITFLCDVEQEDGVVITDKKLKIDLNGKTFTVSNGANTNNRNFKINGSSNGSSEVTITNGTLVAKGELTSGAYGTVRTEGAAVANLIGLKLYSYRGYGLNVKACTGTTINIKDTEIYAQYSGGVGSVGGTINLTNVKIEQTGVYSSAAWCSVAIGVNGGGKVVVNSGTYSAKTIASDANAAQGTWVAYVMSSGGTLEINDGTFNGVVAETAIATNACGIICADTKAVVEINGGTFNSNGAILDMRNNTGETPNPTATLKGGTYSADPRVSGLYSSNLIKVAEGYVVIENNGVWTVAKAVAKIGEQYYTSLEAAITAAQSGEAITLLADVTASEIIVLNKAITLDGNGKTLTSTAERAINVSGADGVTIQNLTINASGERAINIIQGATNVMIDNVTATADNYTVNVAGSAPNAVVAITNSTLNGLCTVNVAAAGAQVTIDNSTINCNDNDTTAGESYAALSLNKEAVGGSIVATNTTVNVTEGSDSTKGRNGAENGTVTINGSAEGVTVTVAVITYPGSDYYYGFDSLESAIEFAKAGDTITLIRDVTITEKLTIEKSLTIDGNGKTLTYTGSDRAIDVPNTANGANLTIKDLTVAFTSGYSQRGINYNTNGKLTLDGVTVNGGNDVTYAVNLPSSSAGATVEINDSSITGLIALNVWGANATVTATDSHFTSKDDNTAENYAAVKLNSNGTDSAEGATITIIGGSITAKDENDNPSSATTNATVSGVINISETTVVTGNLVKTVALVLYDGANEFYSCNSLQEAIETATNDPKATVKLLKDVEESVTIAGTVVLDLNGKTITAAAGQNVLHVQGGNLTIKDTAGAGKVVATDAQAVRVGDNVTTLKEAAQSGTFTLEAGSLEGAYGITVWQNSTVTIKGGMVKGAYAISGNGYNNGTTIAIAGGKIVGTEVGIYHPQTGTLTITGGEISGPTGIEMRAGELTMSAGSVTGTGTYTVTENGNGSTVSGAAIAISQHGSVSAVMATITGGTITADGNAKTIAVANTTTDTPVCSLSVAANIINANTVAVEVPTLMLEVATDGALSLGPAVVELNGTKYATLAAALDAATKGATITLLADVEASFAKAVTIDLNGKSLKGNVAATIVMNGGKYYAADGSYMAGPDGYYATTDATFVLGATAIEIAAGNVSITKEMNTMPGQTLTIAAGASFTVPAGKTINVLDSTIIVNGTLTIEGTVKLGGTYDGTTYTAGTITAAANLAITSGVEGYKAVYDNGWKLVAIVPNEITITVEGAENIAALTPAAKAALLKAANGDIITEVVSANAAAVDALELFDGIVKVDNGKATVDWDFGITDMTMTKKADGKMQVTLTAALTNGVDNTATATFAENVVVEFYNGETLLAVATVEPKDTKGKTEVQATVDLSSVTGRTLFSVKAKTKTN